VIAYRNKQLRSYQTYVTDNWLGGLYGSSGILGTKSGGSMGAAWAVMNYLGDEGYLRLTAAARRAADEVVAAIVARPALQLRAVPASSLVSFGSADPTTLDIFAVADALWRRGWYVDRQMPPDSLHLTVNAVHDGRIGEFVADLDASIAEVAARSASGTAGAYGTVD
jgi:glutamate/tyrosine decarboxylase-like PLP-dependent enzyme